MQDNDSKTVRARASLLRHWALVAATASALAACGGGGGGSTPAEPPAPAPAPALPRLDGGVMKGPVSGATVCVYALASGAKGAQIPVTAAAGAAGSVANGCYVTPADGSYDLRLPAGTSGDVLVEATGGSFCSSEAPVAGGACATGTLVALGGSTMTSVARVGDAAATVYTTPLSTAAVDNARAGGLSSTSFGTAFNTLSGQLLGSATSPSQAPGSTLQQLLVTVSDFLRTGGTFADAVTSLKQGSTTEIELVNVPAVTRGFWAGNVTNGPDGSTRASAVVLPDLTAWVVYESPTSVVGMSKLSLAGTAANTTTASLTGTGFYYRLADSSRQAATATGTANESGALATTTNIGGVSSSLAGTSVSGYTTAATAANAAGSWRATVGDGSVNVTWNITSESTGNNVTGTSTTGCTYAGTLRPHPASIAVYNVAVVENCGTGLTATTKTLDGIATRSAAGPRLNVTFTTESGAKGGVLAFQPNNPT